MLWSDVCQTPAANFLRPRPSSGTLCHFELTHVFKDSSPAIRGLQGQSPESQERAITPKERLWSLYMSYCMSVVLFLKELSHFRIACSLLSGSQSCNPYHFNLSMNFLHFVKIPLYLRLSLHSVPLCCCRVLNSCLKVAWRLSQLSLSPCSCWEQVLDFKTSSEAPFFF